MGIVLIVISLLLIALVLLQSGKAEDAANALSGASDTIFANRKERGGELFISRLTLGLGIIFFVICLILGF